MPAETSLMHQIAAVSTGELTVEDHLNRLLERIDHSEKSVRAFIHLDRAAVRDAARALDRGPALPLKGVIFAAKDNFDSHDMPTAYGSRIHAGSLPPRDAACIAALRLQGALLLGKTVTTEFAHVYPGATTNPFNAAHTPGGSSSGSAAAVASAMVPAAFGTQTTGSVIRPAAYCGTVGFKPTWGHLNVSGVLANVPSFDTVGIITRSVDDQAVIYNSLMATALASPETLDPGAMRIGVCRTPWWDEADEDAQQALETAAEQLARAGSTVVEFDENNAFAGLDDANQRVSGFEFARTMGHERLYAMDTLSDDLRDGRMQTGFDTSADQYIAARQHLDRARVQLDEAFADVDCVITLPAPGTAPAGLRRTGVPTFNMPWTTLHAPAVTLPLFTGSNGLPLGLQLCSARHRDMHLLRCASTVTDILG